MGTNHGFNQKQKLDANDSFAQPCATQCNTVSTQLTVFHTTSLMLSPPHRAAVPAHIGMISVFKMS